MIDCCKHKKKNKKCQRKSDKKSFKLPRKFSKKKCRKPKGFTMKSSCAPYNDCFKKKRGGLSRKKQNKTAYFAGGCFWGIEEKFSKLKGVTNTKVGYMGGSVENPTYEIVSNGNSGHVETVRVEYNPKKISYFGLLKKFFTFHDPYSSDKQGNDVGRQYRAIVFYDNNKQKTDFEKLISKKYRNKNIKTKLVKEKQFYIAEDYHQMYSFQRKCNNIKTENKKTFKKICKNNTKLAEKKGSGKYYKYKYRIGNISGIYNCSCCNVSLYSSSHAYDSGSGWPAFSETLKKDKLLFNPTTSEIRCSSCGLHLGHRTFDGPTDTKIHDCINSACLQFIKLK